MGELWLSRSVLVVVARVGTFRFAGFVSEHREEWRDEHENPSTEAASRELAACRAQVSRRSRNPDDLCRLLDRHRQSSPHRIAPSHHVVALTYTCLSNRDFVTHEF